MTPQETNEAVAKALGFLIHTDYNGIWIEEYPPCPGEDFSPATDPAAALWSLERLGKGYVLTKDVLYKLSFVDGSGSGCAVNFPEAICLAIIKSHQSVS